VVFHWGFPWEASQVEPGFFFAAAPSPLSPARERRHEAAFFAGLRVNVLFFFSRCARAVASSD
jgi:hypothetical protein